MTISGNTMIPGATALVYLKLAEIQASWAEMQKENLSLFTGTIGPDGKSTAGFFEVQKMSNDTALKEANTAADQTKNLGWTQLGEGLSSALIQGGTLANGYSKASSFNEKAAEKQASLNPSTGIRAKVEEVNRKSDTSIEMDVYPKATVQGSNKTGTGNDPSTLKTNDKEMSAKDRKAIEKEIAGLHAQANTEQSLWTTIGQVGNSASTGLFKMGEGILQSDIIKANGNKDYSQGTSGILSQASGIATSAIQSQLSSEQAAAQGMQTIISITGAARG